MSDWARVVVLWNAHEGGGISDPWHRARAEEIERIYQEEGRCDLESVVTGGMVCETVAVYSCHYFEPKRMRAVLGCFDWRDPREVELLWKSEEDRNYGRLRLCDEALSAPRDQTLTAALVKALREAERQGRRLVFVVDEYSYSSALVDREAFIEVRNERDPPNLSLAKIAVQHDG